MRSRLIKYRHFQRADKSRWSDGVLDGTSRASLEATFLLMQNANSSRHDERLRRPRLLKAQRHQGSPDNQQRLTLNAVDVPYVEASQQQSHTNQSANHHRPFFALDRSPPRSRHSRLEADLLSKHGLVGARSAWAVGAFFDEASWCALNASLAGFSSRARK